MTITKRTLTGANSADFIQNGTCGISVPVGATCTIGASFKPTLKGPRSAAISILDNAPGAPHLVSLTGTGTVVKLVPRSLSFGNQAVGTTSAAKQVAVTNTGTTALTINKISITGTNPGAFTQTNSCGYFRGGRQLYDPGDLYPAATGAKSAAVSIEDDGGGSPQRIALSGTGM